jgi:hypothetical protein
METHNALKAGEDDPHARIVLRTPSKVGIMPEEPIEQHRPRAPRRPNGQVCILNLFRIYSKCIRTNLSKYNVAEIKRMWKIDHTGAKCAFHKGKKHASE